jgi:hypothetical protein
MIEEEKSLARRRLTTQNPPWAHRNVSEGHAASSSGLKSVVVLKTTIFLKFFSSSPLHQTWLHNAYPSPGQIWPHFIFHNLTPYYSKVYFNITCLIFQHSVYLFYLVSEDLMTIHFLLPVNNAPIYVIISIEREYYSVFNDICNNNLFKWKKFSQNYTMLGLNVHYVH